MAGTDERDVLRQAADAATALLPKLERKRDMIEARISALRKIVDAHELMIRRGGGRPTDSDIQNGDQAAPRERRRAKRGRVAGRVAEVLADGEPREIPAILELIQERFGERYSSTSVRSVLNRKKDLYRVERGRWRAIAGSDRGA